MTDTALPMAPRDEETATSLSRSTRWCWTGISFIFFVLFLVSAIFQHNDRGIVVWIVFYYAMGLLALVSIAFHCGFFVSRAGIIVMALYGASLSLMVFALVLAILSAVAYAKADAEDEGPDAEDLNDKEEKAFEMGGAILGFVSAVFHLYSFHQAIRHNH